MIPFTVSVFARSYFGSCNILHRGRDHTRLGRLSRLQWLASSSLSFGDSNVLASNTVTMLSFVRWSASSFVRYSILVPVSIGCMDEFKRPFNSSFYFTHILAAACIFWYYLYCCCWPCWPVTKNPESHPRHLYFNYLPIEWLQFPVFYRCCVVFGDISGNVRGGMVFLVFRAGTTWMDVRVRAIGGQRSAGFFPGSRIIFPVSVPPTYIASLFSFSLDV